MSRVFYRILLFLLLGLPFLGIFEAVDLEAFTNQSLDWAELVWALKNTLLQAVGSLGLTLLVGGVGALGLLWVEARGFHKTLRRLEALLILPSFLPSLYVIFACLQMLEPFPMGILGIVLVHSMMNFGLVAVIFSQNFRMKLAHLSESALVLGSGFWQFSFRVALPVVLGDILRVGFFVFAISFTSFAVPLTVGGARGTTIEVLIYEKIRLDLNWNQALLISLLQLVFLFGISMVNSKPEIQSHRQQASMRIWLWFGGLFLVLIPTFWLYGSFVMGLIEGLGQAPALLEYKAALGMATVRTYFLAVAGGGVFTLSYLMVAYLWPDAWIKRLLLGFVSPSTVIIGFGIILLFQGFQSPGVGSAEWLRLGLGFWLLFFPTLFRWGGLNDLQTLEGQIQSARILGAGDAKIFFDITLPQVIHRATWVGGIGAFWISGDFALSRLLLNQDRTLGLMAQTLLSGYRLNLGTLVCGIMLLCGLAAFLTLRGVEHVYRRKFDS